MSGETHLTENQIELLLNGSADESTLAPWIEHLDGCLACRQRLLGFPSNSANVATHPSSADDPCPSPDAWARLALGMEGVAEPLTLLRHAASCASCAALLRAGLIDFGPPTASEAAELHALASASPHLRRTLAQRMAQQSEAQKVQAQASSDSAPRTKRHLSFLSADANVLTRRFAVTALGFAAVLALAASLIGYRHYTRSPQYAVKLLGQSYNQQRTMQLRVPFADDVPLMQTRGAAFSRPVPMIEAELAIERGLKHDPESALWLGAKAELRLLENDLPDAKRVIRRALEREPEDPQLLGLEGAIELQIAESGQRFAYAEAIESLTQALKRRPDDPVLIFNRAIAYEHNSLLLEAKEEWQRYLQIDSKSAWAAEARSHLSDITQRLEKQSSLKAPLLGPSDYVAHLRGDERARAIVLLRNEEYLTLALRTWLPRAYPLQGSADPDAIAAVQLLAQVNHEHGDDTLISLLSRAGTPGFADAVASLSSIYASLEGGIADEIERSADHTARDFARIDDRTGVGFAWLWRSIALQRAQHAPQCLQAAQKASTYFSEGAFIWPRALLLIEQSSCTAMQQRGKGTEFLEQAYSLTRNSLFPGVSMRAYSFMQDDAAEHGDIDAAWTGQTKVLAVYWNGGLPVSRAGQSYIYLARLASNSGFTALAAELWSRALSYSSGNPAILLAADYGEAASMALDDGDESTAQSRFLYSERLFASVPPSPQLRIYESVSRAGLAKIDLRHGDYASVIASLRDADTAVAETHSSVIAEQELPILALATMRAGGPQANDRADHLLAHALTLTGDPPNDYQKRVQWAVNNELTFRALVELRLRQSRPAAASQVWQAFRAAELNGDSAAVAATADYPPSTNSNEVAVSFFHAPYAGWYALVATKQGVRAYPLSISDADLTRDSKSFAELCSDPQSGRAALKREGTVLYSALFKPFNSELEQAHAISIQSDEVLAELPFAALADDTGTPLGLRFAIVRAPGSKPQHPLPAIARRDSALIVDAPAPQTDQYHFAALADAEIETENVSAHFEHAALLMDQHATVDAVLAHLATANVFHFTGHASAADASDELLLAGNDGKPYPFTAGSLRDMHLQSCALVVLSACSTDRRRVFGKPDANDLTSAFLAAGAAQVLSSHWDVDSQATGLFMRYFYDALLSGASAAESVRHAAEQLHSDPRYAHPYFWSAFELNARS